MWEEKNRDTCKLVQVVLQPKYVYFLQYNAVIDESNCLYYTVKEFKKTINRYITDDKNYQKELNTRIQNIRDDSCKPPYFFDEKSLEFTECCLESAEFRVYEHKNILKRLNDRALAGNLNFSRAKEVLITEFLDFRGGFARCPFHEEKTGSLKYYKEDNHVYCFGACKKRFDVVDIVQKIYGYTITDAVKFLNKK